MIRDSIIEFFKIVLPNPIFLSGIFAWLTAQFMKTVINLIKFIIKKEKFNFLSSLLWSTGGMPSSHSASSMAVSTAIGIIEGVDSSMFLFSLFMSVLIIRDSLGVRRYSGLQAQSLNKLGISLNDKLDIEYTLVKEVHGHKPLEVILGALLGFFLALAISYY